MRFCSAANRFLFHAEALGKKYDRTVCLFQDNVTVHCCHFATRKKGKILCLIHLDRATTAVSGELVSLWMHVSTDCFELCMCRNCIKGGAREADVPVNLRHLKLLVIETQDRRSLVELLQCAIVMNKKED